MINNQEEFQVVEAVLNGQKNRYREIVNNYAPLVFNVVNRYVDREDEAEELAQEIFVKTYEKLSSFKNKSKFSSWLYRIAQNHCRDYAKNIRRKNKSFSQMEDYDLEQEMGSHDAPDIEMEKSQWITLLKQGLNEISEQHAEAFLMKYEYGMTYKVMARRLDASQSALKVRVYRAKKQLKEFIEENS